MLWFASGDSESLSPHYQSSSKFSRATHQNLNQILNSCLANCLDICTRHLAIHVEGRSEIQSSGQRKQQHITQHNTFWHLERIVFKSLRDLLCVIWWPRTEVKAVPLVPNSNFHSLSNPQSKQILEKASNRDCLELMHCLIVVCQGHDFTLCCHITIHDRVKMCTNREQQVTNISYSSQSLVN
jgi:hypothetical protein